MTEYNKVFVDTAPIIYFLDDDVNYGQKSKMIFEDILRNKKIIESSVITCEEYLVYPYQTGNEEKVSAFFDFVNDCNINLNIMTEEIAKKAASIRAEYKGFKSMDAIQLATAYITGCDIFLTNDKQLCQFEEIKCLLIDDWK